MARVNLSELVNLVAQHSNWQAQGGDDPRTVLQIVLEQDAEGVVPVFDDSLAGTTVTYEGHHVTVVLDFDNLGYLEAIEFV